MSGSVASLVPLAFPWVAGAAAFFLDGRKRGTAAFAGLVLLLALAATLAGLARGDATAGVVTGGWPAGVGIRLRPDAHGLLFASVALASLLAALAFEAFHGILTRTFPAIVLLLAAGLTGLFVTGDVFNFYVFFEVAMLASFLLASYGDRRREVRAATVFALVNLVGSALFVGAVAALYRLTGTLDMAQAAAVLAEREGAGALAAMLFFVAFALKLGLFPLHFWLPPVYRDTRPAVAAVLSAAVASIGSYGLLRFGLELFPGEVRAAAGLLFALGAASVVYGGVLAASRRIPGEVLGYSAVGQVGYVLLGLALGGPAGVTAAVLYATVSAGNKLVLFLAAGARGTGVATAFALGAFSVAGVPPTLGFAAKLELFRAGLAGGAWLTALLLAGSALSLAYMFQAYQHLFWERARIGALSPAPARVLVLALAGVVLALGLWPEPALVAARRATAVLLGAER